MCAISHLMPYGRVTPILMEHVTGENRDGDQLESPAVFVLGGLASECFDCPAMDKPALREQQTDAGWSHFRCGIDSQIESRYARLNQHMSYEYNHCAGEKPEPELQLILYSQHMIDGKEREHVHLGETCSIKTLEIKVLETRTESDQLDKRTGLSEIEALGKVKRRR